MTWANRYAVAVDVIWPLDGKITQGFGPTSLTLEPPLVYEGRYYPALPPGHRHRRTPWHACSSCRGREGHLRPGGLERSHRGRDRARPQTSSRSTAHLEDPPAVKVGDIVVTGQVVGRVGVTGITTGPHLHFGIYEAGVPVDPLTVLPPKG